MHKTSTSLTAISTFALAIAIPAAAQDDEAPTAPPPNPQSFEASGPAKNNDGAGFLQKKFNISDEEANRRLDLQAEAEALGVSLAEQYPDAFLGLEIQHQPYKVILSMASDQFDAQVRQAIPANLRSVLQIRRSRFQVGEPEALRSELVEALSGLEYSLSFDYTRDRFVITAPESRQADIRARVPARTNALVEIRTGEAPSTFQTNATSADYISAGWLHYSNAGPNYYCTFAFMGRDQTGTQSLLTAEHCQTSVSERRRNNQSANNKIITFALPTSDRYYRYGYDSGIRRSYDFRLIPAPTVGSGPWVWFTNPRTNSYQKGRQDRNSSSGWSYDTISYTNQYSGLPSSGYVATVGTSGAGTTTGVYNPGHPTGAVRCKSGGTTGTTCGLITESTVYYFNEDDNVVMDGLVRVGSSDQPVIAWQGDSGGPVFTQPRWNSTYQRYEVSASGIMHAGGWYNINPVNPSLGKRPCDRRYDNVDQCTYVYMPIDRVNDFAPFTIALMEGTSVVYRAP